MSFPFYKYVGAGNDFVITNANQFPDTLAPSTIAKDICDRNFGVGADGFIILHRKSHSTAEFHWDFYNSDGSSAEMCGNAARCIALFCKDHFSLDNCSLKTQMGTVHCSIENNQVFASWTLPDTEIHYKNITLADSLTLQGHFVDTGVPHFVISQSHEDFTTQQCLSIQQHPEFQPRQTNVTFLYTQHHSNKTITFERGVQNFTLACGTGVIASALILKEQSQQTEFELTTPGGTLQVVVNDDKVKLSGPTQSVFQGDYCFSRGPYV